MIRFSGALSGIQAFSSTLFFFATTSLFSQGIQDYDWRNFYASGLIHYNERHYNLACDYFHRSEGLIKSGRIMFGNNKEAEKNFEPYMVFTSLGDCYANLDKSYRAAEYYLMSLELFPDQDLPNLFLANYFYEKMLYKKSLPYFQNYLKLKGSTANRWAILCYATALGVSGENSKASETLQTYTQVPAKNRKDCLVLEEKKNFLSARNCFIEILLNQLNSAEAYLDLLRIADLTEGEIFDPAHAESTLQIDLARDFQTTPDKINHAGEFHLVIARCLYYLFPEKKETTWPFFFRLYKNRSFKNAEVIIRNYIKKYGEEKYALLQLAEVLREQNKVIDAQYIYQKINK